MSQLLQLSLLLATAVGVYGVNLLEDTELRILDEARQLESDIETLRTRLGLPLPTTRTPQRYWRPMPTTRTPQRYWGPVPTTRTNHRYWGPVPTTRTPQRYWGPMPSTRTPQRYWGPMPSTRTPQRYRGPMPTTRTPQRYWGPTPTTRTPQRQQNYGQQQQLNRRPQTNNGNKSQLNVQGVYQRTNYTRKTNATFTNETNGAFVSYVCNDGICVRQYNAGFYSTVSVGGLVALIVLAVIVVVFARRRRAEISIISDVDSRPLLGGGGMGSGSRSTLSIRSDPIVVGHV